MACPTFVRTQFLGAGIVRYNAKLGWGGQGGVGGNSELVVEVVESDNCGGGIAYENFGWGNATVATTDFFNPPEIGKPVEFHFGSFRFGGILNDWNEEDSATGPKTYLIRLVDPSEILDGVQLICKGYSGETYYMPNLYNVYGWLEETYGVYCPNFSSTYGPPAGFNAVLRYTPSTGYGGAFDRNGLPWFQILDACQNMMGGWTSRFGGLVEYRGKKYYVDFSQVPGIDPYIKFSEDHYSLLGLINEICELAQFDYYVELASENIISIRTSPRTTWTYDGGAYNVDSSVGVPINQRLSRGVVGATVAAEPKCASKKRGLELRSAYVNSFLVGEYRKDMWQIALAGGCYPSATIWPYWGEDSLGNTILGYGCGTQDYKNEHYFYADVRHLGLPGITQWKIDTTQLRCALKSEADWRNYVYTLDNSLENSMKMMVDHAIPKSGFKKLAVEKGHVKAIDFYALAKTQAELAPLFEFYEPFKKLFNLVQNYATTFFGKQFMVKLPYLCKKIYAAEPYRYYTNWQKTDGAWVDPYDLSAGYVLGMHVNNVLMTAFKTEEGLIQCMVKFESTRNPLDLSKVQETDYVQINPYVAYVRATVTNIIHNVGGDPTDSRAVIDLSGPVSIVNDPYISGPEPLALMFCMSTKAGLNINVDQAYRMAHHIGMDKLWFGLSPLPILPVAAAVPLQSTINSYGPWAARVGNNNGLNFSTAGKTLYERDTGFSPWEFGSTSEMNYAGDIRSATQLTDKYVMERGGVEVADAPSVSLGTSLFAGGPQVSEINVNFNSGTGAVTTDYSLQLYTPKYGRLGSYWITKIKNAARDSMAFRRFYSEAALKFYRDIQRKTQKVWMFMYQQMMKRYRASSSHDMLIAEHVADPENPNWARSNAATGEATQLLPQIQANSNWYITKGAMEMGGMFRPFSTVSSDWMSNFERSSIEAFDDNDYLTRNTMFYTDEQVPPILCEEHHMPITVETLSPFLNGKSINGSYMTLGNSVGHDIEYIVRDGTYPVDLCIRQNNDYSTNHNYRGVALRGPLVLAGWGFDTNNKPVPNASPSYPSNPQMKFEDDWLRKPYKWKCGPVDLRWDDKRKVWTAPAPFKIVRLKLCGPLVPGRQTTALMYNEDVQYDKDGNTLPWQACCSTMTGNAKVVVASNSHRPVPAGFDITAFYDTHTKKYHMLAHDDPLYLVQVLYNMSPGAIGYGKILQVFATGADQCGTLVGRTVILQNPLNHPLCKGQNAFTHLTNIVINSTETWCDEICYSDGLHYHIVLQATFRPLCVVTWVSLLECPDQESNQKMECRLIGGGEQCYCYYTIDCDYVEDDWVEYDLCVKDRQIWLQSGWSVEEAADDPCTADGTPGGNAQGGSKKSNCYGSVRAIDCDGRSASCSSGSESDY